MMSRCLIVMATALLFLVGSQAQLIGRCVDAAKAIKIETYGSCSDSNPLPRSNAIYAPLTDSGTSACTYDPWVWGIAGGLMISVKVTKLTSDNLLSLDFRLNQVQKTYNSTKRNTVMNPGGTFCDPVGVDNTDTMKVTKADQASGTCHDIAGAAFVKVTLVENVQLVDLTLSGKLSVMNADAGTNIAADWRAYGAWVTTGQTNGKDLLDRRPFHVLGSGNGTCVHMGTSGNHSVYAKTTCCKEKGGVNYQLFARLSSNTGVNDYDCKTGVTSIGSAVSLDNVMTNSTDAQTVQCPGTSSGGGGGGGGGGAANVAGRSSGLSIMAASVVAVAPLLQRVW